LAFFHKNTRRKNNTKRRKKAKNTAFSLYAQNKTRNAPNFDDRHAVIDCLTYAAIVRNTEKCKKSIALIGLIVYTGKEKRKSNQKVKRNIRAYGRAV
jgi:hypothetical protein